MRIPSIHNYYSANRCNTVAKRNFGEKTYLEEKKDYEKIRNLLHEYFYPRVPGQSEVEWRDVIKVYSTLTDEDKKSISDDVYVMDDILGSNMDHCVDLLNKGVWF